MCSDDDDETQGQYFAWEGVCVAGVEFEHLGSVQKIQVPQTSEEQVIVFIILYRCWSLDAPNKVLSKLWVNWT